MEQTNLPSNSLMDKKDTVKKEKEKITPVVSGKVKKKSKPFFNKIVDNFVNTEVDDIRGYLKDDILIPTIKRTIINMIEMLFYGKTNTPGGSPINTLYNKMYGGGRTIMMGSSSSTPKKISKRTFDDIWFENRGDVENVVDNLSIIMETYGVVSVADLLELSDQSSMFTDNRFGWTNLDSMKVVQGQGGYILKMPPPRPIEY